MVVACHSAFQPRLETTSLGFRIPHLTLYHILCTRVLRVLYYLLIKTPQAKARPTRNTFAMKMELNPAD